MENNDIKEFLEKSDESGMNMAKKKLVVKKNDDNVVGILPFIYISGIMPVKPHKIMETIKKHKITKIISVCEHPLLYLDIFKEQKIEYKHFYVEDVPSFNMAQYFDEILDLINSSFKEQKAVLIHSMMGMNRAPIIALLFMISFLKSKNKPYTLKQLLNIIQKKNPKMQMFPEFLEQVKAYHSI